MMGRIIITITFIGILSIISVIDIKKQQIYNEAVAALFVPAIVSFFVSSEIGVVSRVLGMISVSGIMLLICLLGPGAFGGGDIKLMLPVGLLLGFEKVLTAWVIAVFAAAGYSLVLFLYGSISRNKIIPFAPFLSLGSVIVYLS